MGQCAPSSPLGYPPNSIDDDEFCIVAAPTGAAGCHEGLPLHKMLFQNDVPNDITSDRFQSHDRQRKNFLDAHRPNCPQRCFVDQSEIKRAAWLQSDELLRRHGRLKMHGTSENGRSQQIISMHENQNFVDTSAMKNKDNDDRKSMISEPSMVSAITSASRTTVGRTNTKRISKNDRPTNIFSSVSGSSSISPTNLNNAGKDDMNYLVSDNYMKRPIEEQLAYARAKLYANHEALNIEKNAISYNQSVSNYAERHECMSVLRLKMKANIGKFYTQRYLTMFQSEREPILGTIPNREEEVPELTCESSDSSFSSSSSSTSDHSNCMNYGFMPPIIPVKCSITNQSLFDFAITGCLGLVPREQDHKALRSSRRQLRHQYENIPENCIVLLNKRSGAPLAVCSLKATSGSPVVRIYATRQMAFAQKPIATTQQLGLDWTEDLPLYEWAEVKYEGDLLDEMSFTVFMVKRFDGYFPSQPSYKAWFDGYAADDNEAVRSPVIKMVGRTDSERNMSGCALIWIEADEMTRRMQTENVCDLSFHINLAQGIDPGFVICFTAIVDEILEKSMRMQCQNQTRGLLRKDSFSLTKKRLGARSRVTHDDRMFDLPCKAGLGTFAHCNFLNRENTD